MQNIVSRLLARGLGVAEGRSNRGNINHLIAILKDSTDEDSMTLMVIP